MIVVLRYNVLVYIMINMLCINFVFYIIMYYNNFVSLKKLKIDLLVYEIFFYCINILCFLIILLLRFIFIMFDINM